MSFAKKRSMRRNLRDKNCNLTGRGGNNNNMSDEDTSFSDFEEVSKDDLEKEEGFTLLHKPNVRILNPLENVCQSSNK